MTSFVDRKVDDSCKFVYMNECGLGTRAHFGKLLMTLRRIK